MPLHVGENHDQGGNDTQVRFFDRGSNLHRSGIPGSSPGPSRTKTAGWPTWSPWTRDEARGKAQAGTVEDWATECLLAAREAYEDPATGQRIKPGAKLGDAYQRGACRCETEALSGGRDIGSSAQRVFRVN